MQKDCNPNHVSYWNSGIIAIRYRKHPDRVERAWVRKNEVRIPALTPKSLRTPLASLGFSLLICKLKTIISTYRDGRFNEIVMRMLSGKINSQRTIFPTTSIIAIIYLTKSLLSNCLTEMTTSASESICIVHQKPYNMHKRAKQDKIAMLYSFDSLYVVDSKQRKWKLKRGIYLKE